MVDTIEKLGHSTVQHGLYNRRIYLMKLHPQDLPHLIPTMERLAFKKRYEKILAKVSDRYESIFKQQGYGKEANIPNYYNEFEDALFMTRYFSGIRQKIIDGGYIREILAEARHIKRRNNRKRADLDRHFYRCRAEDAPEMSALFQRVFETYPFPVFDPSYLVTSMRSDTQYYCIRNKSRITAIAAAEIDRDNLASEMTDFATLPRHRGQGLAGYLLQEMERAMVEQGVKTLFSIVRALSPAMNNTFGKYGYTYGGTLINNTNISGRIESMNVWHKHL